MSVASKNLFAALGSDDEDTDSRPVAKSTTSKAETKKITPAAPAAATAPRGGRGGEHGAGRSSGERGTGRGRGGRGRGGSSRGGYSNEDAYKDRNEVLGNHERDVDQSRPRGRGRGSRGSGNARGREFDRHSATGRVDTQKATNQGWGNEATSWESGEPIAEADRAEEKKDAEELTAAPGDTPEGAETPAKEPEREPEEEDHTQTYADWVASQGKSDFQINAVRKPDQSQWGATTSILNKKARGVEDALFGESAAQKTRSSSSSTTAAKKPAKKVVLEIEQRFTPIRSGRGGDRGGRGGDRGGDRGGRGRGEGAPRGRGRGEDRGGRARGGGSTRGRGGSQTIDVADTTAFPALG